MPIEGNYYLPPIDYFAVTGRKWEITGFKVHTQSSQALFLDHSTGLAHELFSGAVDNGYYTTGATGIYSASGQYDTKDLTISWGVKDPATNLQVSDSALIGRYLQGFEVNFYDTTGKFYSGINFEQDGSIQKIDLLSGGSGYVNPTIVITGSKVNGEYTVPSGTGANIRVRTLGTGLHKSGSVLSMPESGLGYLSGIFYLDIVSGGSGYTQDTVLLVTGSGDAAQAGKGIGSGAFLQINEFGLGRRYGYTDSTNLTIPRLLNQQIFDNNGERKYQVEVVSVDYYGNRSTGRLMVDFPQPRLGNVSLVNLDDGISFQIDPPSKTFRGQTFEDISLNGVSVYRDETQDFAIKNDIGSSNLIKNHTIPASDNRLSSFGEIKIDGDLFTQEDSFKGYYYKFVPYDEFGTGDPVSFATGVRVGENLLTPDIPSGFRLVTDPSKTVGTNIEGQTITNTYLTWKKDRLFTVNNYEIVLDDEVEKESTVFTVTPPNVSGINYMVTGTGANIATNDQATLTPVSPINYSRNIFDIFSAYGDGGIQWLAHTIYLDSKYLNNLSTSFSNVQKIVVPAGNTTSGFIYFTGNEGYTTNYVADDRLLPDSDGALVAKNINNEIVTEFEPKLQIPSTRQGGQYSIKVRAFNAENFSSNYSAKKVFTASGNASHFDFVPGQAGLRLGGTGTITKSGPFVTTVGGSGITAVGTGVVVVGGVNNRVTGELSALVGGSGNRILGAVGRPGEASFLGGGRENYISGNRNVLVGGDGNLVSGDGQALVGGLKNIIFGSSTDSSSGSLQIGNPENIEYENSIIGGGNFNVLSGDTSFIGGGYENTIGIDVARSASVYGENVNSQDWTKKAARSLNSSAIVGGRENQIFGSFNFIGGGRGNQIFEGGNSQQGAYSVIAGGQDNIITGTTTARSIILGGKDNINAGVNSIVGGIESTGQGNQSLALGSYGWAAHNGAFVLADSSRPDKVAGSYGHKKSLTANSLNLFFDNGTYVRNGDLYVSGDATISGDLKVSGSFTLGDATTDSLDSFGAISSTGSYISGLSGYFGKVGIGTTSMGPNVHLLVDGYALGAGGAGGEVRLRAGDGSYFTHFNQDGLGNHVISMVNGGSTVFRGSPSASSNDILTIRQSAGYGLSKVSVGSQNMHWATFNVSGDASITGELRVGDQASKGITLSTRGSNRQQLDFVGTNTSAINAKGSLYINYDSDAGGSNDGIFFARDGEDEAGTVDVVIKEGKVGIGTTNPGATAMLTVATSSAAMLELRNDGTVTNGTELGRVFANDGAGNYFAGMKMIYHDSNDGEIRLRYKIAGTNTDAVTFVDGNVGIGTTSPARKLEIIQTTNQAAAAFESRENGGISVVELRSKDLGSPTAALPANQGPALAFQGYNGSSFQSMATIFAAMEATAASNDMPSSLRFLTTPDGSASATEKMRITSAGNVGIGTTNPTNRLEVRGPNTIAPFKLVNSSNSNRRFLQVSSQSNYSRLTLYNNTEADTIHLDTNGDSYFKGGNVGIGTASPNEKLELYSSSANVGIQIKQDGGSSKNPYILIDGEAGRVGYVKMSTNGTAASQMNFYADDDSLNRVWSINEGANFGDSTADIMLMQNGNVGIGTADPQCTLQVNERDGESKFEVDPANQRIRLRDHAFVSGDLQVSGDISAVTSGIVADEGGYVSGTSGYFGKVGIGTTLIPSDTRLHVQDTTSNSTATKIRVQGGSRGFTLGKAHTTDNYQHLKPITDTAMALRVMPNGTTTRESYVEVWNKDFENAANSSSWNRGMFYIDTSSDVYLRADGYGTGSVFIGTENNTQTIAVKDDGKVGIGVTNLQAKLTVNGDASITGELRVAGEGEFATDLYVGDKIRHLGDSNTFLEFSNDLIYLKAGDVNLLELREVGTDYVAVGGLASNTADVNFYVNTEVAGQDYAFVVDAGLPAVGINIDPNDAKGSALVVSGNASITGELRVDDNITLKDDQYVQWGGTNSRIAGSEAGDYLVFLTENSAKMRIMSDGKVGMGTNTPQARLQVNGDASITGQTRIAGDLGLNCNPSFRLHVADNDSDIAYFQSSQATTSNVYISNTNATTNNTANLYFGPANNIAGARIKAQAMEDFSVSANRTADLEFQTRNNGTFTENVLRLKADGKVGIGTASDLNGKLTIRQEGNSVGDHHIFCQLSAAAVDHGASIFLKTSTNHSNNRYGARIRAIRNDNNNAAADLAFSLENSTASALEEMVRFTSDGNVGIATTAPTGKLHIYQSGDSQPAFLVEGSQGSLFSVEDTLTGSLMSVNDIAGLPVFEAFDDGTIVMGQYNSGDLVITGNKVGIGTTNPSEKFHVKGADTSLAFDLDNGALATLYEPGNNSLAVLGFKVRISTNGNRDNVRLVVDNNGLVGINPDGGTSYNPSSLFEVYKGDSKFQVDPDNNRIRLRDHSYVSGNLYVSGSIITADGTSPDHISGLSGYFGKVGIGTTNMGAAPDALTVGALVAGNTKTVQFNSEGGSEIGLKVMSRTNRAVIKVGDNDTNSYIVSEGATSSFGPAASLSASNINLFGGGTVGIGTTTSNGALLTVNGDASITGELKIKNNAYWYDPDSTDIIAKLYDSSDDGIFDVYQNNSPTVRLHGNGDSFFKGGDVFIGPSSPGSLLGIQESQDNSATWWTNAAAQVTIYNNSTAAGSASVLKFQTTSSAGSNARIVYGAATAADKLIFSSRLTEDYNLLAKAGQFACFNAYGSLGLGTLTPEAKLQVSGDASITGELKVNGEVHIPNNLVHKGDTDTYLNFNADRIRLNAGGVELIDAREAGADYVAIGGVGDNPDVNFLVGSAVNGIDYVLEVDAGSSAVGINCDPLDAKGAALVVSGDASITGELRAVDAIFGGASQTRLKVYNDGTYAGIQTDGGGLHESIYFGDSKTFIKGGEKEGIRISSSEVVINEASADLDFRVESDNSENMIFVDAGNDLVGFGTNSPSPSYTVTVSGGLAADYKSFIIDHPDPAKPDKQLAYASSETPEHNVFVRGKAQSKIIELPDHWPYLVHEDSISVQLTPIGEHQELYVESIKDNKILINNNKENKINCFYLVHAERKDIGKLEIEPDKSVNKDGENGE